MLLVTLGGKPIGWCQWYRWADYPAEAAAIAVGDGEAGIDYAIGEPAWTGHGNGTVLIGVLVAEVRRHFLGGGLRTAPEAANAPSRRVLEKSSFQLVTVRAIPGSRRPETADR
jgi:aminoglycoside 6'-N-acetyltransferase